jgi:dihydroorotate dehydrogenase (NAD+) catalytic subunit
MTDLSVDLGFLRMKNPVIAASGTFGYGLEFVPYLDLNRLGGFVVKGLYPNPREGNPPPRIVETPSGLINAIGLQGIGVKAFAQKILPRLRVFDTALVINVCGEHEEEYVEVVEFLNGEEGISAYEINISCPNVRQEGRCPALNPQATYSIVKMVKRASRRPVITKLSPNVTNIGEIALSAQEAGSDALALVNTFLAMAVDVQSRKPLLANVFGGLSGPAIKPIALRLVFQAAQTVSIPVIGMGGIATAEDAVEFMLAGAAAVEVGTANFIQPSATVNIIRGLKDYCRAQGIDRLGSIVGGLRLGQENEQEGRGKRHES